LRPQSDEEEEAASCACLDSLGLSRTQRLTGFAVCFALGTLCSLMSSSFVPIIALRPAKFAIPYTIGNVLSILSTSFLVGPRSQLKSMFDPVRRGASLLYLCSLAITLFAAFKLRIALVVLAAVACQVGLFWCIVRVCVCVCAACACYVYV
jgi:hypothetical protein